MLTGEKLSLETLAIVSSLGIGMGLVSGLMNWAEKGRQLRKDADYSYLMHLKREWKGRARYNNDYNYILHRDLEEFIND